MAGKWHHSTAYLLNAQQGLGGRIGTSQVIAKQVVAVHLSLEAGDVAVAEVLTQLIDLLQLKQVDPQHLDGLHHLGVKGGKVKRLGRERSLETPIIQSSSDVYHLLIRHPIYTSCPTLQHEVHQEL